MKLFFAYMYLGSFISALAIGTVSFIWTLVSTVLMLRHFELPSSALSSRTLWNPINALFLPELLSSRGRYYRRQVGLASATFVSSLVVSSLLAIPPHIWLAE